MDGSEMRTLKEKWNHHWQKKKPLYTTNDQANLSGVLFFWGFSMSVMITALLVAIPHHHKSNKSYEFWARLSVCFIFVECITNWIFCIAKRSHVTFDTSKAPGNQLPEGWENCLVCQVNTPPRSHHCKICNACVLKRDLHCFFTGVCVGFRNQRYFMVFTFYSFLGSVYGAYLVSHYLGHFYDVRSHEGWTYIPFVATWECFTGNLALSHFILMMQLYAAILMAVISGYFFLWQMSIILAGRTTYEVTKGIRRYGGRGIFGNIRSVFGNWWVLQFIFPISTSLPGDGTSWKSNDSTKWQ